MEDVEALRAEIARLRALLAHPDVRDHVPPPGPDEDRDCCPICRAPLEYANEVDIGVGVLHGGPRGCPGCYWVDPSTTERSWPW